MPEVNTELARKLTLPEAILRFQDAMTEHTNPDTGEIAEEGWTLIEEALAAVGDRTDAWGFVHAAMEAEEEALAARIKALTALIVAPLSARLASVKGQRANLRKRLQGIAAAAGGSLQGEAWRVRLQDRAPTLEREGGAIPPALVNAVIARLIADPEFAAEVIGKKALNDYAKANPMPPGWTLKPAQALFIEAVTHTAPKEKPRRITADGA